MNERQMMKGYLFIQHSLRATEFVAMRLLHASCGRDALPGGLGSEFLPWRLPSGRFTGRLLGTSRIVPSLGG